MKLWLCLPTERENRGGAHILHMILGKGREFPKLLPAASQVQSFQPWRKDGLQAPHCMYVYIYTYVSITIVSIPQCRYVLVDILVYMYLPLFCSIYIHIYHLCLHICTYIYIYIYIYHTYIYIYNYIYILDTWSINSTRRLPPSEGLALSVHGSGGFSALRLHPAAGAPYGRTAPLGETQQDGSGVS